MANSRKHWDKPNGIFDDSEIALAKFDKDKMNF